VGSDESASPNADNDPEQQWCLERKRDLLERHLPDVMAPLGAFEIALAVSAPSSPAASPSTYACCSTCHGGGLPDSLAANTQSTW
jgi:hypothetical protein